MNSYSGNNCIHEVHAELENGNNQKCCGLKFCILWQTTLLSHGIQMKKLAIFQIQLSLHSILPKVVFLDESWKTAKLNGPA